jgi:hypothetical protein
VKGGASEEREKRNKRRDREEKNTRRDREERNTKRDGEREREIDTEGERKGT